MESYKTRPADTPEEIKRQKKVRADLNAKLMQLLRGETQVIPPYQFTNLPGVPNHPWERDEDKEPDVFFDRVRDIRHNYGFGEARYRVALREKGVIVPDNVPIREKVAQYTDGAQKFREQIDAYLAAGGCLWHFQAYRNLLALRQYIEDKGFDIDLGDAVK